MNATRPRAPLLAVRGEILRWIRHFFHDRGYLEVETPVRIPAPAPEAHIEAATSDNWYLQSSPEICMKRLLARGYPRIFQICRCFRKGERGSRHLPEMTLLEWYTAGEDYRWKMAQVEEMVRFVAKATGLGPDIVYQGERIDLAAPWHRVTVKEACETFAGIRVSEALEKGRFDEIMALQIEPRLGRGRPAFLMDYPPECGALARIRHGPEPVAERFELYVAGVELCNAFSELTDPGEQRRRFEAALRELERRGGPAMPMPEKFLQDLEWMPECTGCALGVDRLVMLFSNARVIDEVVAFTPESL